MLCEDIPNILKSISVQSVEETIDMIIGRKDLFPQSANNVTTKDKDLGDPVAEA